MLKRFSATVVSRVLAGLLQLATFAVLARSMTLKEFGALSLALFGMNLVQSLSDFGMNSSLLRGLPSDQDKSNFSLFVKMRCGVALAAPIIATLMGLAVPAWSPFVLLGIIWAIGDTNGDVAGAALQGRKRMMAPAYLLVGRRIAALLPLLILGNQGLAASVFGVYLIGNISLLTSARKYLRQSSSIRLLVKANFPYMLNNAAANLTGTDGLLVGSLLGVVQAGLYSGFVRFLGPINLVVSSLMQSFTPEIANEVNFQRRLELFLKVRRLVVAAALSLMAISPVAPAILVLILGPNFEDGRLYGIAVFLAAAFSALAQVYLAWFNASGIMHRIPSLMIGGAIFGLAAQGALCVCFGALGAAIGMVITQAFLAGALYFAWRRIPQS